MASHYGNNLWSRQLARESKESYEKLIDILDTESKKIECNIAPIFLFRGMSGTANATALSQRWVSDQRTNELPFGMVYVRKPYEKAQSHGDYVEHNLTEIRCYLEDNKRKKCKGMYVFVDDFVSGGRTRSAAFSWGVPYVDLLLECGEYSTPQVMKNFAIYRDAFVQAAPYAVLMNYSIDSEYLQLIENRTATAKRVIAQLRKKWQ